jgi:pimeloyl-ACP methyl ester carboxylesterase
VEDLEAFRNYLGDSRFWRYGESYGTQFAQTYATAHPDRLAGLILDGPVDLLHALADTQANDYQALARAAYDSLGLDADTPEAFDDLGTDFLVDGQRPPDRETTCPGDVILPYTAERRASR